LLALDATKAGIWISVDSYQE